jgi:hypothetical protein
MDAVKERRRAELDAYYRSFKSDWELRLLDEDDTAEHVLEYLDRVRDSGNLDASSLRRNLSLEQIGYLTVLRISDAAFDAVVASLFPEPYSRRTRQVSVNLGSTTLTVIPTTPRRP